MAASAHAEQSGISSSSHDNVKVEQTNELQPWKWAEARSFMLSACRVDGECLGWLPTAAYDARHEEGRIHVVYNNDDLVGYVLWAPSGADLRIHHTWVRKDARLILHGRALVDRVNKEGWLRGLHQIGLWCAIDLAANLFWNALGFTRGVWRWGRAKRGRKHWQWTRLIVHPSPSRLSPNPPHTNGTVQTNVPLLLPDRVPAENKERPMHRAYGVPLSQPT